MAVRRRVARQHRRRLVRGGGVPPCRRAGRGRKLPHGGHRLRDERRRPDHRGRRPAVRRLPPDGRPGRRGAGRRRGHGRIPWSTDAAAARQRRAAPPRAGGAHCRPAALRMAGRHAGLRPALLPRRDGQALHRSGRPLQAEPFSLAPDRGPGLAPPHRTLSRAAARRQPPPRIDRRRHTARRRLHGRGDPRRDPLRAGTARHRRAGGRAARPLRRGPGRLPAPVVHRRAVRGGHDVGDLQRRLLRRQRRRVRVPTTGVRRGPGAVPGELYPHRRGRGAQGSLGGLRQVPAAHAGRGPDPLRRICRRGSCAAPAGS